MDRSLATLYLLIYEIVLTLLRMREVTGDSQVTLTHGHGFEQDNNVHWFLACINFREKRTEVYDSMGSGRHEEVHRTLLRWLQDEHQDKVLRVFAMNVRAGQGSLPGEALGASYAHEDPVSCVGLHCRRSFKHVVIEAD